MKKTFLALLLVLPLAAQAPAPAAPVAELTVGAAMDGTYQWVPMQFIGAAEAMPAEKFDWAPTQGEFKGVKTFAQQVRHVASANFMFAAGILGEKPPVDLGGENGPEALKTKAEVIKYLKDSFTFAHRAFGGITDANATASIPAPWGKGSTTRLYLASLTVAHAFDHYGQMAVYLRMNGIIPPASRKP